MNNSKRPERPPSEADAAKIAEWMECDFGWSLAEGIKNGDDENDHADK